MKAKLRISHAAEHTAIVIGAGAVIVILQYVIHLLNAGAIPLPSGYEALGGLGVTLLTALIAYLHTAVPDAPTAPPNDLGH